MEYFTVICYHKNVMISGFFRKHPLLSFILRRVLVMIPILLVTFFFFFFFMSLAPGDFYSAYYENPEIDDEVIGHYRREFGLDQPFYIQYLRWLKKVVIDWDLGMSFSYRQPITSLIAGRLRNTLALNFFSLMFSYLFAYPIAFYFAYKPSKRLEQLVNSSTLILFSIPSFFLALLALLIAAKTGLFPLSGATSANYDSLGFFGQLGDRIHHLLLPVMVGFVGGIAGAIRGMKVLLGEEFRKPYVTAVKARGVGDISVIKHAFRNALIPFITEMSGILAGLISGSLFTEIIFGYPGIGSLMYEAALRQDYYLVLTNMIMSNILVLGGILISDMLLALADPRVRIK